MSITRLLLRTLRLRRRLRAHLRSDGNNSGSLAILAAIRRAPSRISNFAADLRPLKRHSLSLLLSLPILRVATDSDLFELANDFRGLSQPIAFGQRSLARVRREGSIFLFDCVKVLLIGLNGLDFTGHGVQFLRQDHGGGQ